MCEVNRANYLDYFNQEIIYVVWEWNWLFPHCYHRCYTYNRVIDNFNLRFMSWLQNITYMTTSGDLYARFLCFKTDSHIHGTFNFFGHISVVCVYRFAHSLRFCYLKFDKEAISDSSRSKMHGFGGEVLIF